MDDITKIPNTFYGMPVITSNYIGTDRIQYRFPKSKKKRIRKKWAKNPQNWKDVPRVASEAIINGQKTLVIHPDTLAALEKHISKQNEIRLENKIYE